MKVVGLLVFGVGMCRQIQSTSLLHGVVQIWTGVMQVATNLSRICELGSEGLNELRVVSSFSLPAQVHGRCCVWQYGPIRHLHTSRSHQWLLQTAEVRHEPLASYHTKVLNGLGEGRQQAVASSSFTASAAS